MSEIRGKNSLRLLSRGLGVQGSFSRAKDALFQDDNERWNLEVQLSAPPGFHLSC